MTATVIVAMTPATRGNAWKLNSWSKRMSRRKSRTPMFSKPASRVVAAMASMIGARRGSLKKAATGHAAATEMAAIKVQRSTIMVKAVS